MNPPQKSIEERRAELDRPLITTPELVALVIAVLSTWAIIPLLLVAAKGGSEAAAGQVGDTFGSVNALFSAAAFAGIIYTILLQRRELALQRLELEETREELRRSAEAQIGTVESSLLAAQIDSVTSKIEHYPVLIEHTRRNIGGDAAAAMEADQRNCVHLLTNLYQEAKQLSSKLEQLRKPANRHEIIA